MKALLLTACAAILSGCLSPRSQYYSYPNWARNKCVIAHQEAHEIVRKVYPKIKPHNLTVLIRKAENRINGHWCWYDRQLGMYIGGLTSADGRCIIICVDPDRIGDPDAIHYGSLVHEMMHHWLNSNRIYGHDPAFDHVAGWKQARERVGQ